MGLVDFVFVFQFLTSEHGMWHSPSGETSAISSWRTFRIVVNSPVNREVNALYRAVDNNLDRFAPAISVAIQHLDSGDVAAMLAGGSSRSRLHSPYQIYKIITLFMAQ